MLKLKCEIGTEMEMEMQMEIGQTIFCSDPDSVWSVKY